MQRSTQRFATCRQGEEGKAKRAVLCSALAIHQLIKESKLMEPSHTITGLRTHGCTLSGRASTLSGQAQSGWFLKCAEDNYLTQAVSETTRGGCSAGFAMHKKGKN